jgi:hypothetical protein
MSLIDRVAAASRELVSADGNRRARVVLDQHGRPAGVNIDHADGRQSAMVRPDTIRATVSLSDRGVHRSDAVDFVRGIQDRHGAGDPSGHVRRWAQRHGSFLPERRIFLPPTPNPQKGT